MCIRDRSDDRPVRPCSGGGADPDFGGAGSDFGTPHPGRCDIDHSAFEEACRRQQVVGMSSPTKGASVTDLFSPYQLGHLELANRLVMAPLTRNRCLLYTSPSPR